MADKLDIDEVMESAGFEPRDERAPAPPDEEEEDRPDPDQEPEEDDTSARIEPGPGAFGCPDCGRSFHSQRGLSRHITDIHGRPSPNSSRQKQSGARGPYKRRTAPQQPPRRSNAVQALMNYAYMGGGLAFGSFGPKPEAVRQIVGTSMVMTAGPAAGGLTRTVRRFPPLYAVLEMVAGAAQGGEDLAPLGVPLLLGLYGYARPAARAKLQPFVAGGLTQLLCMIFGVDMPVQEQAMDMLQGIERTPEGMQEMAMTLLGALDAATEPNHAAAAPAA